MWRPDLQPLPCRQNVRHTTGVDGKHTFVVADTILPGTVLDISLCMEVPVVAIDQFPYLWDFVIIDATTQTVCVCVGAMQINYQPVYPCEHTFVCRIPQTCLPLSYAALIPTTPNTELANVRVSLSSVLQNVSQRNVRFLWVYVQAVVYDKKKYLQFAYTLLLLLCVLFCILRVYLGWDDN